MDHTFSKGISDTWNANSLVQDLKIDHCTSPFPMTRNFTSNSLVQGLNIDHCTYPFPMTINIISRTPTNIYIYSLPTNIYIGRERNVSQKEKTISDVKLSDVLTLWVHFLIILSFFLSFSFSHPIPIYIFLNLNFHIRLSNEWKIYCFFERGTCCAKASLYYSATRE